MTLTKWFEESFYPLTEDENYFSLRRCIRQNNFAVLKGDAEEQRKLFTAGAIHRGTIRRSKNRRTVDRKLLES
jgi:hypothetical protein